MSSNGVKTFLILLLAGLLGGCVALITPKVESEVEKLKAGQYALDKTHAVLLFKIKHLGLSTYVGRFNNVDASLDFDPENLADTRLTALVDMTSIDINNAGLERDLAATKWLNLANYPQAKFTTQAVEVQLADQEAESEGQSSFKFTGVLDWRGVRKPVVLEVVFLGGANNILTGKYTLGFSATGSFLRSDFGMDAFIPLVGDEIQLEAHAEFLRD